MTKEQILQQINETFDNLLISKPLTKQQMINNINERFEKLLIEVNE